MLKLLKIEWLKFRGYRFFWIGMGLYFVCMILLFSKFGAFSPMQQSSDDGNSAMVSFNSFGDAGVYKLPYIWHNITYLAGFFKLIPAFILALFIANEFQYKTHKQNVIDGLSISEFYLSKILSAINLSLISLLAVFISSLVLALSYNSDVSLSTFFKGFDYFIAYFVEVLFFMILCVFLTFLFKKSVIAIIVILMYYFVIEPIAAFAIGEPISSYLPTQPSRNLITQPFTRMFNMDRALGIVSPEKVDFKLLSLSLFYTLIFAYGGFFMLKKQDL